MNFIRIESVQGQNLHIVVEVTVEEYSQIINIINERNRRAEIERQNEQDWERERQWYQQDNQWER